MVHEQITLPSLSFGPLDAQNIAAEIEANAHRINVLASHASTQLNDLKNVLTPKLDKCFSGVAEWELLDVLLDVMATQAHEIRQLSERIELWGVIKIEPDRA